MCGGFVKQMADVITITVADEETGEYIRHSTHRREKGTYRIMVIGENPKIRPKESTDGYIDIGYESSRRYSVYECEKLLAILADGVSGNEAKMFLAIAGFINDFHTGRLMYPDKSPVSSNDLVKMSGMTKNCGYEAIRVWIERGVIAREKCGREFAYYANPFIFCRGKGIEKALFDMFINTKWADKPERKDKTYV